MNKENDIAQKLLESAKEAAKHAYAPYSNFPVGVALLTEGGQIIKGCNVENAVYGLGICGEVSAISNMIASGARYIQAIYIYAPRTSPCMPCGRCRQVISEFVVEDAKIFVGSSLDRVEIFGIEDLLPHAFTKKQLI